ncbi:unnamed protein product [Leuciscus chuanchicus]
MREEEEEEEAATSQFDSPYVSRVYGVTMAEIWLANVSVSLDEPVNHRSNETQCRLSANGRGRSRHTSCGPMGWLDSSVGGVAERSEKKEKHSGLERHKGVLATELKCLLSKHVSGCTSLSSTTHTHTHSLMFGIPVGQDVVEIWSRF